MPRRTDEPLRLGANSHIRSRQPVVGDIMVTKVGDRYHIGRVQADRDVFTTIAVLDDRTAACNLACQLASGRQRVFIYRQPAVSDHLEIDCAKPH
jgi:hypothetical protein